MNGRRNLLNQETHFCFPLAAFMASGHCFRVAKCRQKRLLKKLLGKANGCQAGGTYAVQFRGSVVLINSVLWK